MTAYDHLFGRLNNRRVRRFVLGAALCAALTGGVVQLVADPASPVTITDVDSPDPVASGAQITHTITIVNTGGAKINNVVLSDQLNGVGGIGVPPQLQIASTRGMCAQTSDLLTCNAGAMEGNGTWTVSIRGIVTAANGTALNNTVSVTGTKSAQNFTTTNTVTTIVSNGLGSNLPDLSINKTGPASVAVTSPMTYTLTVNNTGTQNATDIVVVDTVPAPLTIASVTGTSLFTCAWPGNTVTCTGGAVNAGSNATITINANTPSIVPVPDSITNTAVVDPDNLIVESNELNNTSALVNTQITLAPTTAPLSINITDDPGVITGAGPDPVIPGQLLTYKALVTNNAATRADDVTIVIGTQSLEAAQVLASQLVMNGTVGNSGGCTTTSTQARCIVRTLQPGGTILMTVSGYMIGSAGSFVLGTGTVTGNIRNSGVTSTDTELTTVKPLVDLTITKTDAPDPVCARSWPTLLAPPGAVCLGGLTYTYVVGNSGINPAVNVVVRDPLPPGTIFDHATPAICSVNASNVLTCNIASVGGLLAPPTTTFSVVLVAPSGVGTIANTVTVDPNNAIFESDETNNTATASTLVTTGIDLVVKKEDAIDPIATSGTQTYTLTIDNLGPQDATGIRVRDTLPSGTIFRDVVQQTNGFTCSYSSGTLECVGGSVRGTESEFYGLAVPNPDAATIKFRIFAQSFEGTMHNEVRVDPNGEIPEINEGNNFAFQDTVVARGGATEGAFNELTISKTQLSPTNPVARNAKVKYSITIGNNGTDPAVNVAVRDFLPAGSRYIEATGTNSFHCTEASNVVNCVGGTVPAGGSSVITMTAFAPDTPGVYTNQAIVDPDSAIPEGNEFNNEASVSTTVANNGNGPFNELTISKTGDANTTPGGPIEYTLTVTNSGSDPALNVAVSDVLPASVTFVDARDGAPLLPGAFTCSESSLVVTCIGGTLPAGGGTRAIKIHVTAPNDSGITLVNQAIVDPQNAIPEGDEDNNTAQFATTVNSLINLKITKSGPKTSSQSQVTDYKLKIQNDAFGGGTGETAFNVEVHDPLPVGVIPLAVDTGSGNNFQCQIAENPINVVDCIGDLNPGAPVEITITVFMTAESSRSLDNEACIDPDDTIKEFSPPGETDNCSTHSNPVGPAPKRSPDFLISKGVDTSSASPGDTLTYTIAVSNIGDAKHKGAITLTDKLPAHLTAVDISGPNLWTCSAPAATMTCTNPSAPDDELGVGAVIEFTIHATVNADASLPLVNVATVSPALHDASEPGTEDETSANQTNNTATAKTSVGSANFDLSIGAITDNPDPAIAGRPVKYTIVGLNGGSQDANGVKIHITLPAAGTTFIGADGTNGFNCAAPVGTLVACVGNLPAGGDTVITLSLNLILAPPPEVTITATIDPMNAFTEINEGNNTQTETTTVSGTVCIGCVDLVSALLIASPEPVASGGTVTFTYVLINAGDQPTTFSGSQNIAFFDFFVAGHTSFSISTNNPLITCTTINPLSTTTKLNDCKGNLGGGQGVTITATIGGVTGDAVTATATADPADLEFEVNEGNNILTETVNIP